MGAAATAVELEPDRTLGSTDGSTSSTCPPIAGHNAVASLSEPNECESKAAHALARAALLSAVGATSVDVDLRPHEHVPVGTKVYIY